MASVIGPSVTNLHHPTLVWVGGQLLPQNRGIQIKRHDHELDTTLNIGASNITAQEPPLVAFYTKRNQRGEYVPTERVPLDLYITARWKDSAGGAWWIWFRKDVGVLSRELPMGWRYGQPGPVE